MRNITQEEVTAIQNHNAPIPERAMFEVVVFGGSKQKYHAVHSDNAHYFLEEGQFLAESADGKTVSVIHVSNMKVPEKKPQQPQKKRKKYIRPTGTGYLEKIPFDFDKLEVGDKVRLRDGDIVRVEIIEDSNNEKYPIFTGTHWHAVDGSSCVSHSQRDILYILKHCRTNRKVGKHNAEKSVSKTDKWQDEFALLDRSTGKEVVFTRKELQIVKELIGSIDLGLDKNKTIFDLYYKFYTNGFFAGYEFTFPNTLHLEEGENLFKENV